jgi:type I restriction enzyme M protein
MLSNPPFGTAWKTDLKAWGDIDKKDITDPRFVVKYNKEILSLVPDIGDPQMLFLANNISKMKTNTPLGSRIVEVHNGSSLFTGKAGQGPSNLRQYIIEQDLLEAIVALPEKMFYNTGIGTYLWVLANKKSPERRGKVQLIDATALKTAMRKNLGEKNCMMTEEIRRQVLDIYMAFDKADPEYSKVFDNSEFGYWLVEVNRPLRLSARLTKENIEEVVKKLKDTKIGDVLNAMMTKRSEYLNYSDFIQLLPKSVKLTAAKQKQLRNIVGVVNENAKAMDEADPDLKDTEQIPFNYPGEIEGFIEKEVRPYAPDVWIDEDSIKTGYELSFTRYFYKPAELRSLKEISKDLRAIERETDGLLDEILG